MLNKENLEQAVTCLKTLAHPTRLGILYVLRDGEKTVCELQNLLNCSQSNISQHLGIMRDRHILHARRDANQVYYEVRNPSLFRLLEVLQDEFCQRAVSET